MYATKRLASHLHSCVADIGLVGVILLVYMGGKLRKSGEGLSLSLHQSSADADRLSNRVGVEVITPCGSQCDRGGIWSALVRMMQIVKEALPQLRVPQTSASQKQATAWPLGSKIICPCPGS
jgi:hypothetical protein